MKLQEYEVDEMKKYRRFSDSDMVPWDGGDYLATLSPVAEENEKAVSLRSPKHPRLCILKVKERFHLHYKKGHQTGTKSEYYFSFFNDSHGWCGRKPRKARKD